MSLWAAIAIISIAVLHSVNEWHRRRCFERAGRIDLERYWAPLRVQIRCRHKME